MKATTAEVRNNFDEYLQKAQDGPGTIEEAGQDVAVLLSRREYDILQALEDRVWGERAMTVLERNEWVGTKETMRILTTRLAEIETAEGKESRDV